MSMMNFWDRIPEPSKHVLDALSIASVLGSLGNLRVSIWDDVASDRVAAL